VRFLGFVPAERLPESHGLVDVALVTLRPGFEGLIVPSKLFGYLSRGIPVLSVGPDSDVERLLVRYACGVAVRNADEEGVTRAIRKLHDDRAGLAALGAAGQAAYEAELARERGLARYAAVVKACLDRS
jgi:glycosyltransferase involved in cell wall biosynthesis